MARVSLGEGKWFTPDEAVKLDEGCWFDGSNHISRATGSQWDHETLYCTRKGGWVLRWWSQRSGSKDDHVMLSDEEAANWVLKNELSDSCLEHLPEAARLSLLESMKEQEV